MKDIEGMHIMTRRRLLNFAQNSPKPLSDQWYWLKRLAEYFDKTARVVIKANLLRWPCGNRWRQKRIGFWNF
jgi:hypothetical protein